MNTTTVGPSFRREEDALTAIATAEARTRQCHELAIRPGLVLPFTVRPSTGGPS